MRIAYLDCFSGISGDMFLGALVDAGVSPNLLEDAVEALDIGAQLKISHVTRGGISATKVDVYANGEKDLPREVFWKQQEHDHPHEHSHEHHAHDHDKTVWRRGSAPLGTEQSPVTTQIDHAHGRRLTEIRAIINKATISNTAKATAVRIFEALGQAEAEIHNTSVERVHFHEVGAVDAMVDIVCAAVGAESLAVEQWICSPLNVGGGTVQCAHGTLPVPAPATLKLLRDAPVYSSGPQVELVTPTGAAIVKILCTRFAPFPAMKIEKAGYGAGTREFPDHPNLLRLTIGEAEPADAATTALATSNDKITVLEANLDDLSPQVLAYAMERLLAEGALDVFSVPVQMKKSRPGALAHRLGEIGRRKSLNQADLCRNHNPGRAPPRGAAPDALSEMGNSRYDLGSRAHQDCQHEWQHLKLRSRIRRLPGAGGGASHTAERSDPGSSASLRQQQQKIMIQIS